MSLAILGTGNSGLGVADFLVQEEDSLSTFYLEEGLGQQIKTEETTVSG